MLSQEDKLYILDRFDKKIRLEFSNLKSNYTRENAEKYHTIYEHESIENIINNSECIFTEPYYGIGFYKEFVTSKNLPPYTYVTERNKVQDYVDMVADKIDVEQKNMYESVIKTLDVKIDEKRPVINLWKYMESSEAEFNESNLESSLLTLYSSVDLKNESTKEIVDDFITESHSVPVQIITGLDLLLEYDEDIFNNIIGGMTLMNESTSEPDWTEYELFSEAVVTLASLRDSNYIKRKIDRVSNPRLYKILEESMNTSVKDLLESLDMVKTDYTVEIASTNHAVQQVLVEEALLESSEDDELKSFGNIGNVALERATLIDNISAVLFSEFSMDYNKDFSKTVNPIVSEFIEGSVSIDNAMDYFVKEYSEQFHIGETFLEYTSNGEATKVVRNSAGTLREEPGSGKNKKDDYDEYKSSSKMPRKPEKPEGQGITTKIQNKALDIDAKAQKVKGKIGKGLTNLKNAGKAIISAPASIIRNIKTIISDWEKADENKRKELMLKPGYRTMIHKLFRTAIKYKIFFAIGKLFTIKMWIIKRVLLNNADKKRTLRIRNELAAELDTEIKVCEEKINDANADQNQKEKYKLMRLRDKLVAERTRVRTNSKYI